MNDDITRDLLRQLRQIKGSAQLRIGEVTGVAPLDVALGGSGTSYEDVKAINAVGLGELVAVLVAGNDLLVLGAIGDGTIPHARVYNSANFPVANNTATAITFDSERWDHGGLHSTSSNTSRLVAPVAGLYTIGASIRFASSATGIRQVRLFLNSGTIIALDTRNAVNGAETDVGVETQYRLSAGDYVEAVVLQTSGGSLNVNTNVAYSPEFWATRVCA